MTGLLFVMLVGVSAAETLPGLVYAPDNDAIFVRNGTVWDNRPLYCNRRYTVITAGEMPSLSGPMGTLYVGIGRGETRLLLQHFAERVARYRPGRMEWEMTDPRLLGLKVRLTGTTLADASGFTAQLVVEGAQQGDAAAWCVFPPKPGDATQRGDEFQYERVLGRFSAPVSQWEQFNFDVGENPRKPNPNASGNGLVAWIPLVAGEAQCIAVAGDEDDPYFKRPLDPAVVADAAKAFADGLARVEAVGRRIVVETPDPYFNAGVAASCAAMDGLYVEPAFVHGGSAWRMRIPGWRVMDGATAYGWHDRAAAALAYYDKLQVKRDDAKTNAVPSANGCEQAENSRFYGAGFLQYEGLRAYEFQTQFFDQCVREWRATADRDFEKRLMPMLELQLDRCKACFDPDDDGLYESYNNTWPSDSVWFNGGATPEQSAYVYYACRAAADMWRHAGNGAAAAKRDAEADKIRAAINRVLWLGDKGQFASYIEQGGHQRVHDDAWVYAQHISIEVGLTTPEQTWQAMYYTEWAMERFKFPYGGEMRQTTNWVPGMWSARELYHGDNFAMALGYFLGGQGDDGWEILRGTMLESMYCDPVPKAGCGSGPNFRSPGGLSHPACSIDFNDITSMFCRSVVEGLFGYRPDYPNRLVRMAPAFPSAWANASIRTPDFSLAYRQDGERDIYQLSLARSASVEFRVPVRADKVNRVAVNGREAQWKIEPWAGCGMLMVSAPAGDKAELAVELTGRTGPLPCLTAERQEGQPGCHLALKKIEGGVPRYQVTKVHVPERPETRVLREAATDAAWKCVDISGVLNGDVRAIFKQDYRSPRPNTVSMRIGYDGYRPWTFSYFKLAPPQIGLQNAGLYTAPPAPVHEAVDPALANPTGAMTLEAWITPGQMPSDGGRIIDRTTPGTYDGFLLDTWPGNSLRLLTANGMLGAPDVLSPGKPVHVAGVYDPAGRVMQLYLDGREIAARSDGDFPPVKPIERPLRIGGADTSGAERFVGEIGRVAVHDRALSPEQLAARAKGAVAPATAWDWDLTRETADLKRIDTSPDVQSASNLVEGDRIRTPQGVPFAKIEAEKNIAFTSLWDNWPRQVTVPVNVTGDAVWLLVCGSTNPMQGRIANAVLRFRYADGQEETFELVPPLSFWSLCRFGGADYDYKRDGFSLAKEPPLQAQLGENCRAMVYGWKLRPGVELTDVTLETLSQEVVIGLMGVSVMNPK